MPCLDSVSFARKMTALSAYKSAWKAVLGTRKMWLLLYGLTFLLAFLSSMPLKGFMAKNLGNSLSLNQSLPGFDYGFIGDILNEYGDVINLILNQSFVLVVCFFLISIFLLGGIISIFKQKEIVYNGVVFWEGCSRYFWRLLRLSLYFIFFHLLLLGIFVSIYLARTNGFNPFETESEILWIRTFQIMTPIYLLFATFLFLVHDYAKLHVVHSNKILLTIPILQTFRFVFRNLGKFFSLYLLNILTFLFFFGIYYFLKNSFLADSFGSITLLFLLTQLFVILRVGLKLLNLSGVALLYVDFRADELEVHSTAGENT